VIRTNSNSSDRLANCTSCHCNPSLLWAAQERLVTCPEYVGILGQPLLPVLGFVLHYVMLINVRACVRTCVRACVPACVRVRRYNHM
jgi:hypothetical protein